MMTYMMCVFVDIAVNCSDVFLWQPLEHWCGKPSWENVK